MFLPDKLLEKAFYWGPLFVGVISLVAGVVFVQFSYEAPSSFVGKQIAGTYQKSGKDTLAPHNNVANLPTPASERNRRPENITIVEPTKKTLPAEAEDKAGLDDSQRLTRLHKDKLERLAEKELAEKELALAEQRAVQQMVAAHKTANLKAELEKSAVSAGSFAGDIGASSLLSAMAVTDLSAVSYKTHFQNQQIEKFSELAGDFSVIAFAGARFLDDGPLRILGDYNGYQLGKAGNELVAGLGNFTERQNIPLIAHKISLIGARSTLAFAGASLGVRSGAAITSDYLEEWSGEIGAVPLFILTGLANSLEGATAIKRQYEIYKIGGLLSERAVATSYKGLSRAIEKSETLIVPAAVQTALPGALRNKASSAGSCADRFYTALGQIYTTKITFLRDAAKPVSAMDSGMPGRWYFGMGRASLRSKALRRCARWKTYNSGRRKCLKWKRIAKPDIVQADPTNDQSEKEFYAFANELVRGKGRHPFVKARSPSQWVISRIATDLNMYSKQEPHPAICTGALGMMSYFDGNLARVKKHMAEVAEMALRSEQIIRVKGFRLNEALERFQRQRTIGKQLNERAAIAKGMAANETFTSDDQADVNGEMAEFEEVGAVSNLAVKVAAVDLPKTLLDFGHTVYGAGAGEELALLNDDLTRIKFVRQLYDKNRTVYSAAVNKAVYEFLHALEASMYIRRTDRIYQTLSERLFGSIEAIRSAHKAQCICAD